MSNNKFDVILSSNSDFGKHQTVGARQYYIAKKAIEKKLNVRTIARKDTLKDKKYNVKTIMPMFQEFSMVLKGINVFIYPVPVKNFTNKIYDTLGKRHIKKSSIYHGWDFCPKSFSKAKKLGAITILDLQQDINEIGISMGSDYYIAPGKQLVEKCLKLGIKKEQIFYNPFGVDVKEFKCTNFKKKKKKITYLFVGALEERKGIKYLLEAWEKLNLKDAELIIIGTITKVSKPLVKKYSHNKSIKFMGHQKPQKFYKNADVFVFPTEREGSAKATYEAMASGLPQITTYQAGSIIENGKEGFIVKEKNSKEIADKIKYFYNNRNAIIKMGKAARKKVEKYTWDDYSNRLYNFYQKVIKDREAK